MAPRGLSTLLEALCSNKGPTLCRAVPWVGFKRRNGRDPSDEFDFSFLRLIVDDGQCRLERRTVANYNAPEG